MTSRAASPVAGAARHRAVLFAGTTFLSLLLGAPAASAGDPGLQLSSDGVHYAQHPTREIFSRLTGYVPGDLRPGTIWVRNAGGGDASFSLAVRNGGDAGSSALTGFLSLQAGTAGRNAASGLLPEAGSCREVVQDWKLLPGQALRLDLSLGLNPDAPNATRRASVTFEMVFLLQDRREAQPVAVCAPQVLAHGSSRSGEVATTVVVREGTGATGTRAPQGTFVPVEPQSNVEANDRSPWPLILAGAGVFYVLLTLRKRSSRQ